MSSLSFRSVALAMLVGPLAGCGWFGGGDDAHKGISAFSGTDETTDTVNLGNGVGLNLPVAVAGFTRGEVTVGKTATEATATYTHPGGVEATVHVQQAGGGGSIIPFSGGGSGTATRQRSDAALTASIARTHPDATPLGARDDVFTVRFGVVQAGRAVTLATGDRRILIEAFCCIDNKWSYEYRFDAPAGPDIHDLAKRFADAIAWSREPGNSVEQPE